VPPEVTGAANPAELARRSIDDPLIYGGGARRGRGDALEVRREREREGPSLRRVPELDHNEICGWGQHGDVTVRSSRSSSCGTASSTIAPPLRGLSALIEECVCAGARGAGGRGAAAQLLDLMYVGDWTSCYLHSKRRGPDRSTRSTR
jgi:glucose/mannose-6-phosphate isomerase